MKTAIIIPARYGSTRFPGKPLAQIAGKTMLARVVEAAAKATQGLNNASIHIATDHEDIAEHARGIGVDCIMTDESCKTGSDRVLQAAQQLGDRPDFVLNLQGDAPFTPPDIIRAIIETAQQNPDYPVITPAHPLRWNDLDRLRENKKSTPFSGTTVTVNAVGRAMWFSKNIIPAIRKEDLLREANDASPVHQHIGLYGYRMDALEQFCTLPEGVYEKLEGLEQLRLLENDIAVHIVPAAIEIGHIQSGIDTPEDLARAEEYLKAAS